MFGKHLKDIMLKHELGITSGELWGLRKIASKCVNMKNISNSWRLSPPPCWSRRGRGTDTLDRSPASPPGSGTGRRVPARSYTCYSCTWPCRVEAGRRCSCSPRRWSGSAGSGGAAWRGGEEAEESCEVWNPQSILCLFRQQIPSFRVFSADDGLWTLDFTDDALFKRSICSHWSRCLVPFSGENDSCSVCWYSLQEVNFIYTTHKLHTCLRGLYNLWKKYNTINPSIVNSEKDKQRNRALQSNHVGVTIIKHTPN